MSSSESDDDEEAQKINEAVFCQESRADVFTSAKNKKDTSTVAASPSDKTETTVTQDKKGQFQPKNTSHKIFRNPKFKPSPDNPGTSKVQLKSNRPRLNEDNEDDHHRHILKTTPEFRAFVAKHLEKLLDQELETCLARSVWKSYAGTHDGEKVKRKRCHGLKLLANSTRFLTDTPKKEKPQLREQKISKVKKPRLSTSSESSEDEKINACIFTVQDIEEENKILGSLAKNTKENHEEKCEYLNDVSKKLEVDDQVKDMDDANDLKKTKKKKKKKKNEIKDTDIS